VSARRALFAGMNAAADAMPPLPAEREVSFDWLTRSGSIGACWAVARLGWPTDCRETSVPEWLVLGFILRAADMAHVEEVQAAAGVSLLSEGFEMIETDAIIGQLRPSPHDRFDGGNEHGFDAIARDYLAAACEAQGRRAPNDDSIATSWSARHPAAGRPDRIASCGCAGQGSLV